MTYDTGFMQKKVYAARSLKPEYLNPMAAGFDLKDLIQVLVDIPGGYRVWINIRRKQLRRRRDEMNPAVNWIPANQIKEKIHA